MDIELIDLRVKKAYERYYEVRNPQTDELALKTLDEFHSLIENWDKENSRELGFVENFLVGPHMDAIAARGPSAVGYELYKNIMTRPGTLRKLAELFLLRRDHYHDENISNKIVDVRFTNYVVNIPLIKGDRPIQYTNRVFVSIFIEIMTSIAKRSHLDKAAELLGINPEKVAFAKLQIQVRQKVEESLMRQDLGNELTKFSRSTIAYHIPFACEEQQP